VPKQPTTPTTVLALPPLSHEEQAQSHALVELIRSEIGTQGGAIPFSRFMELALYAPGLGYYTGGRQKFGSAGDFVTAPELGRVFASCLGRQCQEILQRTGGNVLESGAGRGTLAADLLLELERLGALPHRYQILELSPSLRREQETTLSARAPHLAAQVEWIDGLPAPGFRGGMVANELLDALPVERFRIQNDSVIRLGVGWQDDSFVQVDTAPWPTLTERVAPMALATGYESEVGLAAEAWVRSMAEVLDRGAMLLIDYGFPRREFYHPDRSTGTLMCHFRHFAHADPFRNVGAQDITAHVDFTAMASAAHDTGAETIGFCSQAMFLLDCGLDQVAADNMAGDVRSQLALANEIKKLTLPHEMGELFKVLAIGRGIDDLRGFRSQNRMDRL